MTAHAAVYLQSVLMNINADNVQVEAYSIIENFDLANPFILRRVIRHIINAVRVRPAISLELAQLCSVIVSHHQEVGDMLNFLLEMEPRNATIRSFMQHCSAIGVIKRTSFADFRVTSQVNEIAAVIENDDYDSLQQLPIEDGIPPLEYKGNDLLENPMTVLDYAAYCNSVECFESLLEIMEPTPQTIRMAVAGGNHPIIRILIERADERYIQPMLEFSALYYRNDIFNMVCSVSGVPVSEDTVVFAAVANNTELLETMTVTRESLARAVECDNIEAAELILQKREFELHENIAFSAIQNRNCEMLSLLLVELPHECLKMKDVSGRNLLTAAVRIGDLGMTELLLSSGIFDINEKDGDQNFPLLIAAQGSMHSILSLLLQNPFICADQEGRDGITALSEVCRINDTAGISILLSSGHQLSTGMAFLDALSSGDMDLITSLVPPDISRVVDREGCTPLIKAVISGHVHAVQFLVEAGCDTYINAQDRNGDTALIHATRLNRVDITGILLTSSEIDVNLCNLRKESPLMFATRNQNLEMIDILCSRSEIDIDLMDEDEVSFLFITHV